MAKQSTASQRKKDLYPVFGEMTSPAKNIRLSDPEAREAMAAAKAVVTASKENALRFLQSVGIVTASGRLAKRYGG
ncbi:hypothetical protein [Pandoraea sp. NPDC090278]|uniref:hypothetical protein n=1 Tax=Pandoraea sp. NPDC090278 TaxID=3364391 RepID=UPI00383B7CC9